MKNQLFVIIWLLVNYCSYYCNGETLKIGAIFERDINDDDSVNEFKKRTVKAAVKLLNEELYAAHSPHRLEAIYKTVSVNNPFETLKAACSLIENGVIGILGPNSEDNSNVVQSVCDDKDIPHLEVRWDDQPVTPVINVYPYQKILTRIYREIITAWNFDSFVILYENNQSLKRVGELLKLYNDENQIIVRQLDKQNLGNYRTTLKEVWRSEATHFVLDCSLNILEDVLRQAQQIGLMTNKQSYIITNLDFHTLDLGPFQYGETNITGLRFIDPGSRSIIKLATEIFDTSEIPAPIAAWKVTLEMALVADVVMMFGQALKNLPSNFKPPSIVCNSTEMWPYGTSLINLVKGMKYPGLTGNIQFDIEGYRSNFGLELIEVKEGGVITIGNWTSSHGLNISRVYPPPPPQEEGNLVNRTFIVTSCLTEPYVMRVDSTISLFGNARYEGFAVDLIHELSLMEGFNYIFSVRNDNKNGNFNETTKTWDGMIGEIIDGTADLAIGDLTITSDRVSAADFTPPFMSLGISILFKRPSKADPSFFSFATPFALDVWEMLAAAFVVSSISMFILGRICPAEWQNPYPCIEEPEYLVNQMSLKNCFWFMTGSLMQQGSEIAPIAMATRMIAGMWWFFVLLMVASYTANLAACLSTEPPDILFGDVNELVAVADKKNIKYGAKKGGATFNFFAQYAKDETMRSGNTVFKKIGEHMLAHEDDEDIMVGSNNAGVKKAEEELYAFFMESTSIEYETERRCTLEQVGMQLDEKGYGIAMKKNSSYRNILSTAILKLQETGKLSDLKRKWWQEQRGGGQCPQEDSGPGEGQALDLRSTGGVFWVTIIGTALSIISVFIEMILHIAKRSIKTKLPFFQLLKEELVFCFRFSSMVKPVQYGSQDSLDQSQKSSGSKSKSKSKSRSKSRKRSVPMDHIQRTPYGFIPGISKEHLTTRENVF